MPRLFFEDFTPGWSCKAGPVPVTKDEMIAFARDFDPQPFHTDEEAAKATFTGRLIASGWHTCSLTMRLLADGFLLDAASMGAPGVEEVRWIRPVLPDETLEAEIRVIDRKESRSRPEMGLVRFETEVRNPRGEAVLGQTNWIMLGRRGHPWPPQPLSRPNASSPGQAPPPMTDPAALPVACPFLEDLEVGAVTELGAVTFEPETIIRFAKAFDPQVFHVDPEAAPHTAFGGLCASGWHTGSAWMRLMVDHRQRCREEAIRRGETPAELGPSPGFRNLRWSKPVYAGDTVAYRSTLTGARPSANRPGWGIASHRNSGINQHGEEVFSFEGAVLWQRRP